MREHVLASAVAILTAVVGLPQTDEWQLRLDEGATAEIRGDYPKAASAYRAATEIADRFDRRDPRRAVSWNALATMEDALGRFAEAEGDYQRALKAAAESGGKAGGEYGLVLGNLGSVYVETGRLAAGEKLLRQALAIHAAAVPPDELRIAIARNGLAEVLTISRKYQESEGLLVKALAVLEKNPNTWGESAIAMNNLGVARFFLGRQEESKELLLKALATMEQHMGPDHPMLARTLNNLASLEARTGHREEAGERLRRALDIAERRLGADHPVYAGLLANYAAFLRKGGEKSRAKALEAKSREILIDNSRRNGIGAVVDVSALRHR
jgi:tetratricopeptide (TPR) repeat protein